MTNYLKWGVENYVELFSIVSATIAIIVFFRRWISNAIRSIRIGNAFHDLFGDKPVQKIKEEHEKLKEHTSKMSIRLDIHERYLSIGLFICEPEEGKCVWTNEYLNNLFGLDSTEMHGFGWMRSVHPEDRERVYKIWLYSIENNIPYECEYRCVNQRNKTELKVIAHSIAAMDELNEVVCYVGYITECK